MLLFGESDTVSHHFWMFHDSDSPRHPEQVSERLRDAIPAVYQRLDEALGRLIEAAGPEHVCVVSDHGFGGAGVHALYLNRYLEAAGWLKYRRTVQVEGLSSGTGLASRLRSAAATHLPADWQGKVYRAVPDSVLGGIESRSRYGDLDLAETRALSDEMNYAATIRLNMPDQSPKEREQAIDELRDLLMAWEVDGHHVVKDVFTRESLYEGACVDDSPEIIVELHYRDGYSYTLLPSARVPAGTTWRRLEPHEYVGGKGLGMNGTHRQHGVLSLWGEGVREGVEVSAGMADIAPTLLKLMGEAIPAHMDGRVIDEALSTTAPTVEAAAAPEVRNLVSASEQEAEAIRQRLERLGYL